MKKFDTPAYQGQQDTASLSADKQAAFSKSWSQYVTFCTQNSQMGNPWTSTYDHPRSWYFNPLEKSVPPSSANTVPIQWTAFPNRINHYFSALFSKTFKGEAEDKLHQLADIGPKAFQALHPDLDMKIPANPCNPEATKTMDFGPDGPRGWQDEYCEWTVQKNANGALVAVNFTHENPEYWFHLWRISPDTVVSLYQEILNNTSITKEDLYLLDKAGDPVIVRETGAPAYNPINKWNSGPVASATSGGAIHLTSPPNSLGAEIYLGAAATILRAVDGKILTNFNTLICAAKYGQIYRNSDPRIGGTVNGLVHEHNLNLTLTNPIALYGQEPDFSLFEMPTGASHTIQDCYTVVRGKTANPSGDTYYPNAMILHSRFEVPTGANFTLGDIKVNGKPLKWGSQIADTFKVQLAGTGHPAATGEQPETFPPVEKPANPLPYVQYVLDHNVLKASMYNQLQNLSNLTSCVTQVEVDSVIEDLAILTGGADENTTFNFGKGVAVISKTFTDLGEGSQLFVVTISVGQDVLPGARTLALSNAAGATEYPTYGTLEVVPKGSLAPSKPNEHHELTGQEKNHLKALLV